MSKIKLTFQLDLLTILKIEHEEMTWVTGP